MQKKHTASCAVAFITLKRTFPAKYFVDQAKAQGREVRVYKSYIRA